MELLGAQSIFILFSYYVSVWSCSQVHVLHAPVSLNNKGLYCSQSLPLLLLSRCRMSYSPACVSPATYGGDPSPVVSFARMCQTAVSLACSHTAVHLACIYKRMFFGVFDSSWRHPAVNHLFSQWSLTSCLGLKQLPRLGFCILTFKTPRLKHGSR